jgi:hypothetical protein
MASGVKVELDENQVKTLAELGLTQSEMAAVLDCSIDTIQRRFHDLWLQGHQKRNASLRRKQFELALKGNPTMLVWLGKQYLEQSDKQQVTGANGGPIQAAVTVTFVKPNGDPS